MADLGPWTRPSSRSRKVSLCNSKSVIVFVNGKFTRVNSLHGPDTARFFFLAGTEGVTGAYGPEREVLEGIFGG